MKIIFDLTNPVKAFSIRDEHIEILKKGLQDFQLEFKANRDDFKKDINGFPVAVCWRFKKEWLSENSALKKVYTPAAGSEWIDTVEGIEKIHGHFHGKLMSESILASMLYFNRKLNNLIPHMQNGLYNRDLQFDSVPMHGQTVLIVGYGNIGKEIARTLSLFNCHIYGLKRDIRNLNDPYGTMFIQPNDIENILPECDHVISVLPGGSQTDNFFKRHHFELMKQSAIFYNFGRGTVVNDELVFNAVKNNWIGGAALDVYNKEPLAENSPLRKNENILLSPHSSCVFKNYIDIYLKELIPMLTKEIL